jgi:hypothetical protein
MNKAIQSMLISLVLLAFMLSGCTPGPASKPIVFAYEPTSTPTPEPTSTSAIPAGDFEMSWNIYDSQYNSLGGILTIRRQGSKYTQTLVMSDGSSGTTDLTVIPDSEEIKLTDRPGDPSGDYMFISSTGYLYFCDNQGVIYTVPLLK